MPNDVTSKHLKGASELTLVADILPGFVGVSDVVSYASRLGRLMTTLFELRRRQVEAGTSGSIGPLERLHSLYFVRWSILDGSKLLLAVSFDSPWETYIRAIVDEAGPLLDVIFCHCEGYQKSSTADGYLNFAEWVRAHQVNVPFFYAGDGEVTVTDLEYLKRFQAAVTAGGSPEELVRLNVLPAPQTAPVPSKAGVISLAGASRAFMELEAWFPDGSEPQKRERTFFRAAVWEILRGLVSPAVLQSVEGVAPAAARYVSLLESEAQLRQNATTGQAVVTTPTADLREDVQGNILTGYPRMTHGCLALLGFDSADAARAFLAEHSSSITLDAAAKSAQFAVNVALTLQGLRTLGVSEAELGRLPKEFREGMEARAPMLGDVGAAHPSHWELPSVNWRLGPTPESDAFDGSESVPLATVDMVLQLQVNSSARERDHLWTSNHPVFGPLRRLVADRRGVRVLHVQPLRREFWPDGAGHPTELVREHFGFQDGLSQPVPRFDQESRPNKGDEVNLGEVFLGYPSDRGEAYPPNDPPDFCRNGSFLVARKLEQDVPAFREFLEKSALKTDLTQERIAAKLMGRARAGHPLVPKCGEGSNDFDYSSDPLGDACPLRSHIRRSNPRTPSHLSVHGLNVTPPRLLRRGFAYGPSAASASTEKRGVMFLAYNASIAEQYEVVQRWINGGNSTGLLSSQNDPIVGTFQGKQVISFIDGEKAVHLTKDKPFVQTKWGLYLFVPSLSGIQALLKRGRAHLPLPTQAAREGEALIGRLKRLEQLEGNVAPGTTRVESHAARPTSGCEWKKLLEDRLAGDKAGVAWTAVRELHDGALRTPYGVLVGGSQEVANVLADESAFSVREYWSRMTQSVGGLYLGMDRSPCPMPKPTTEDKVYETAVVPSVEGTLGSYAQAATIPNEFIRSFGIAKTYAAARVAADAVWAELAQRDYGVIDVRFLAAGVVSQLSKEWFGFPSGDLKFEDFLLTGRNIFYPHPDPENVGTAVSATQPKFERALSAPPLLIAFEEALSLAGKSDREVKQAALGATQGFVVPTMTSIVSVLMQWIENSHLWRLGQWLSDRDGARLLGPAEHLTDAHLVGSLLFAEMIQALRVQPAPGMLHRKATANAQVGTVQVVPGDTVVVSLRSALQGGAPWQLMFGECEGGPKGQAAIHACPGKDMAIGVMLGTFVCVLAKAKNLQKAAPTALKLKP